MIKKLHKDVEESNKTRQLLVSTDSNPILIKLVDNYKERTEALKELENLLG